MSNINIDIVSNMLIPTPTPVIQPTSINNGVNQIKITTPNYPSNNLDKKPFTTSNMNIPSVQLLSNPLNIIPSPFAKQRQTGKVHLKISPTPSSNSESSSESSFVTNRLMLPPKPPEGKSEIFHGILIRCFDTETKSIA